MNTVSLDTIEVVSKSGELGNPPETQSLSVLSRYQSRPISHSNTHKLDQYNILQPSGLNNSDLKLTRVLQIASSSNKVIGTILHYKGINARWFIIKQFYDKPQTREVPFALDSVTIGGRLAAFYTFAVRADNQPGGMIDIQVFLWEYGPFLLEMQGALLSRSELITIGSSLVSKSTI